MRKMAYDFVVVGATGLQGNIVSRDLLEKGYRVLLCGRDRIRIKVLLQKFKKAKFEYVELRNKKVAINVLKKAKAHIVINCAEGDYNLEVQKICLDLGLHYLDLGSDPKMTAKQFALHKEFQKKKLCAITGCGSVPGIGNIMLRYAAEKFDKIKEINVGYAWKANMTKFVVPFSIISIIEEFVNKPVILERGRLRRVKPQGDMHYANYPQIGRLRTFLVEHAEPYTYHKYLKQKGIRSVRSYASFPEFSYRTITTFIKAGLGSKKPAMDSQRPIDLLYEELKSIKIPKGYREKENLWLTIKGNKNGRKKLLRMNCIVATLNGWEKHGCNIDTGLPCSIMAQMLKEGTITATGSRSPEFFVPVKPFFKEIAKRKMIVHENSRRIN